MTPTCALADAVGSLPAADDPLDPAGEVRTHLSAVEHQALRQRIDDLLADGAFPEPDGQWPAIPWPPI